MPNRRRVLRGVVTSVAEESRWCYRAKGVVKLPEQAEDEDEPEESQGLPALESTLSKGDPRKWGIYGEGLS